MSQALRELPQTDPAPSSEAAKILACLVILLAVLGGAPIAFVLFSGLASVSGGTSAAQNTAWCITSLLLAFLNVYVAVRVIRSTLPAKSLWLVPLTSAVIILSFIGLIWR